MRHFSEQIARFGPDEMLSGMLTRPSKQENDRQTAILIPNTGIGHRSSHHRLFVIFAAALAEKGYSVLRFDLSGLGDSGTRAPAKDRTEVDCLDLEAAVDWLRSNDVQDIYLLGLCSGADRSIFFAGLDKRVTGVILLDPTIPIPPSDLLGLVWRKFLTTMTDFARFLPHRFSGSLSATDKNSPNKSKDRKNKVQRRGVGPAAWIAWYKMPAHLNRIYARFVASGRKMHVIFTSGVGTRIRYRKEIGTAFKKISFGNQLSVDYLENTHHLLVLEKERHLAIKSISSWLAAQKSKAVIPDLPANGDA